MKVYDTGCDMAAIKIHTEDVSLFFSNESGDGENRVIILDPKDKFSEKGKFLGHFTVKNKAWLSGYDCDDSQVYEFSKGRYFVQLIPEQQIFEIKLQDQELHS